MMNVFHIKAHVQQHGTTYYQLNKRDHGVIWQIIELSDLHFDLLESIRSGNIFRSNNFT